MVLNKDDFILRECKDPGIVPARPWFMGIWFENLRHDSDRLVNIPEKRLILETEVEWPIMKEEL